MPVFERRPFLDDKGRNGILLVFHLAQAGIIELRYEHWSRRKRGISAWYVGLYGKLRACVDSVPLSSAIQKVRQKVLRWPISIIS